MKKANKTCLKLFMLAVAMFGFGFAMVPLYNVFCSVTGLNGKTDNQAYKYKSVEAKVDTTRSITIQFLSTNNGGTAWPFKPSKTKVVVHPGEIAELSFYIRNPTGSNVIGQAIPSVTPFEVTGFLHKTECFCFTNQPLKPFEEKDMPLKIVLDPAIPKHIKKITLSYTLFDVTDLYKTSFYKDNKLNLLGTRL